MTVSEPTTYCARPMLPYHDSNRDAEGMDTAGDAATGDAAVALVGLVGILALSHFVDQRAGSGCAPSAIDILHAYMSIEGEVRICRRTPMSCDLPPIARLAARSISAARRGSVCASAQCCCHP